MLERDVTVDYRAATGGVHRSNDLGRRFDVLGPSGDVWDSHVQQTGDGRVGAVVVEGTGAGRVQLLLMTYNDITHYVKAKPVYD